MGDDESGKRGSEDTLGSGTVELTPEMEQFINRMGQFFDSLGVMAIGGRIWGLLLICPEPLTAEQIANTLRVSRGSISTNMRILTQSDIVERLLLTGDRRDYYRIPAGGLRLAMQQRSREVHDLISIAEQGLAAVATASPARANLQELADYARFATTYLDRMQEAWLEHRAQNRKESK